MSNNNTPSKEEALQALAFIEDIWEMAPDLPYTKKLRAFISGAPDNQPQGELNATRLDTNDRATAGNRGARPDLQHIARDGHEPGSSCVESHPLRGGDGMVVGDITPSTRPGCAGVHLPLDASAASAPLGWLYDWTHSSALGKPDEHFTGFTTDETYARKHDNPRPVWGSPDAANAGEPAEELLSTEQLLRGVRDDGTVEGYSIETYYQPCKGIGDDAGFLRVQVDDNATDIETRVPHSALLTLGWRKVAGVAADESTRAPDGRAASPRQRHKLVPVELTPEMVKADPYGMGYGRLHAIWSRLLAAVPSEDGAADALTHLRRLVSALDQPFRYPGEIERALAPARAYLAPPSGERPSAPAPEGSQQ